MPSTPAHYRADIRPGSDWLWVYLIVLITIVGVGGYGLWAGSRPERSGVGRV